MTTPDSYGKPAAQRLVWIGLLAAGVAVALYVAGRLHQPDYSRIMFGVDAFGLKSLLSTIAVGLAALQVLLALWLYRKLPVAGEPPRPVRQAHRVIGFGLFALTVPIAAHCLVAYGVQLTSLRVAIHSIARLLLLRCVRREGSSRTDQAAAGMGTAGRRRDSRRRPRRALVYLSGLVLQRLPATPYLGRDR